MPTPFETTHARQIVKFVQQADALAAKAAAYETELKAAESNAARAEEFFLGEFSPENARALARAKDAVRTAQIASEAIASAGGAPAVRTRALRTPEVFAALADGFTARIGELETMRKAARKELGAIRAELTERGKSFLEIEGDAVTTAWVLHERSVTTDIANSTFSRTYCEKRGAGYAVRTFEDLFSCLTAPIPTVPAN